MNKCIKSAERADRQNIVCCSPTIYASRTVTDDGEEVEEVENGFNTKLATDLVEHLDKTIQFCMKNKVIARELERKQILVSHPHLVGTGYVGTTRTVETDELKDK